VSEAKCKGIEQRRSRGKQDCVCVCVYVCVCVCACLRSRSKVTVYLNLPASVQRTGFACWAILIKVMYTVMRLQ